MTAWLSVLCLIDTVIKSAIVLTFILRNLHWTVNITNRVLIYLNDEVIHIQLNTLVKMIKLIDLVVMCEMYYIAWGNS